MIGLIIISLSVPQMKKKLIIILATAILCIAGIYIYHICQSPAGDTAESREEILNTAVQKGSDWSIVKENRNRQLYYKCCMQQRQYGSACCF